MPPAPWETIHSLAGDATRNLVNCVTFIFLKELLIICGYWYSVEPRTLFGYLLTCPRTGAWRGSV
jgi:hypothetical protein